MFDPAYFDPDFFDTAVGRGGGDDPSPETGPWIREGTIHVGHKPNH